MSPIPLTETQMAELFRLRAENAALQTEIAELRIRMNAYQQAWNSDELEKSLSVENAALKEQMAHIKEIEFPTKCIAIADIWKNKVTLLDETIAQQAAELEAAKYNYIGAMADCKQYVAMIEQQAEAIRLKDEALKEVEWEAKQYCEGFEVMWQKVADAIAIQPSPEILQARDERVAEACCKVVDAHYDECEPWLDSEMLRAEWKKYL